MGTPSEASPPGTTGSASEARTEPGTGAGVSPTFRGQSKKAGGIAASAYTHLVQVKTDNPQLRIDVRRPSRLAAHGQVIVRDTALDLLERQRRAPGHVRLRKLMLERVARGDVFIVEW